MSWKGCKTFGKHINNALKEELLGFSAVAKFATTAADGKTYHTELFKGVHRLFDPMGFHFNLPPP
jgi:hypothetical protein